MKHRSYFLLVLYTSFLYFAAGFCTPDNIWNTANGNPYENESKYNTTGCPTNMILFGPSNQYRCNCKDLRACDFGKNGKCKDNKCKFGFGGPFCQRILYKHYLVNKVIKKNNSVFAEAKLINKSMLIHFHEHQYRINYIKIHCNNSDSQVKNVTLHIGSSEFCNKECSNKNISCTGDGIGKNLNITITGNNPVASLSIMRLTGCSPFWFGKTCDKQCHCINNEECHKFTGKCPSGCEKGRSGPGCQNLNYENVALTKSASQSSTYNRSIILKNNTCQNEDFQFSANLAVDGNIDQQFERRSCMHTVSGHPHTWTVNLGKTYNISQIRIYNRNANMHRLYGAKILVGNKECFIIRYAEKILDIKCGSVIAGENITIKRNKNEVLHFCEVEVLQCLAGFYGDRCSKNCSKCKSSSCEQWTGRCVSGCRAGYLQKDTKLCEACSDYKFGENCQHTCHCKNNANCNKETGICGSEGCAASYKGNNCQKTCSDGEFGENCQHTCHCKNNANCDKRNGTCGSEGCAAGYEGNSCQDSNPNIFIPITIVLAMLLVIIAGIAIYLTIKLKKKEDKTSVSQPNVSLPENVAMNFAEDNENVYDEPKPLEKQESYYTELF